MDYTQAFVISAAGMTVERARVDVAAVNLANANTVQDPQGGVYRPLRAVARNTGMASFAGLVEAADGDAALPALPTVSVEAADVAPRMVYDPGHSFANTKGFVAYPGVDTAVEMVTMMSATRAYEANVAAMNAARTMALKALDIGGST
ncbi:flagellar basal body rod protein FlgC [Herbaspirillum frisingense]|uniref:flagellar basal body rod protein FlgC n=1 Tax=Herbaspirillum frisingense TaxID=92645 RepID=UPI0016017547|nr:flagellar basal body rod protein FlgC [Herbaspirillum frisingense]QNB08838.1 flagellar basal body rod protein FlgC [Herbaspirillum frisingense]